MNDVVPVGKAVVIIVCVFIGSALLISGAVYVALNGFPFPNKDAAITVINEEGLPVDAPQNLDGAWVMGEPNNNDEYVRLTFSAGNFTMVSEQVVASGADYIYGELEDEEAYYDDYFHSPIEVESISDAKTRLRVTTHGTFKLTDNEIEMVADEETVILPFSFDADGILIDEALYVRAENG